MDGRMDSFEVEWKIRWMDDGWMQQNEERREDGTVGGIEGWMVAGVMNK